MLKNISKLYCYEFRFVAYLFVFFLLLFGFLETSFLFIYPRNSCVRFGRGCALFTYLQMLYDTHVPPLVHLSMIFCKNFHYHAPLRADFDFSFNGNFMSILFGFYGQSVWAQISWANSVVLIETFF